MVGNVSNVSFNGGYNNISAKDLENLAKYAVGTQLVPMSESPLEGVGLMLGITGLIESGKVRNWVRANGGLKQTHIKDLAKFKADLAFQKDLLKNGGWKKLENYKAISRASKVAEAEFLAGVAKAKAEKAAQALAEGKPSLWEKFKSLFTSKKAIEHTAKRADKLAAGATAAEQAATAAKTAATGAGAATAAATGAEAASLGSKATKAFKTHGGWFMVAIEGVMEAFNVGSTYSELGAEKGTKQLAKSTVKVGASVGGWVAGAAAGAAIGSALPIAGTAVGAVVGAAIGMVGGCIGSWLGRKGAEAVVGKDELELAKEEQAKAIAAQAEQSPETSQQLMEAAAQRIQAEGAESEEAKVVIESLTRLANKTPQSQVNPQMIGQDPTMAMNNPFAQNMYQNQLGLNSMSNNPFGENDFMNQDMMAMQAGLVSPQGGMRHMNQPQMAQVMQSQVQPEQLQQTERKNPYARA